ncbi:ABC transporter substrate-binding protein [Kineosporia mesophila]|uniref:ABC transporter substrate-binding protein n=1 Tax=Kineosporia mesophila TaxID=566012 RepID=A0ABP6ZN63_9ACTN|nr:ABC transporter substrate-binding protein [Kineosporia mesophila]MCD5355116.1 ABC transporter substrate-binding protein [Kineosporia mesophila]
MQDPTSEGFRPSRRALLLSAFPALALAACGSGSSTASTADAQVAAPASLVDSGTLTYGTAASFPPFEYKDGTDLAGFDIEMIEALAALMGLKTKAQDGDFDGLIPALQGKRVDVINSAMYIKPEREAQVDFVRYLKVGEAILTTSDSTLSIQTLPDDLSGRTVAVTRGAIGETYMTDFNTQLKEKGLAEMKLLTLPNNQDAQLAVQNGRADAFDTSSPSAAYLISQTSGKFKVQTTFDNNTEVGIAVRKGETSTSDALQKALDAFVSSGDYQALLDKYNLPAESNYFSASTTAPTTTSEATPS